MNKAGFISCALALDPMAAIIEHTAKNAPWMNHVHLGQGYCKACGKYVTAGELASPPMTAGKEDAKTRPS